MIFIQFLKWWIEGRVATVGSIICIFLSLIVCSAFAINAGIATLGAVGLAMLLGFAWYESWGHFLDYKDREAERIIRKLKGV